MWLSLWNTVLQKHPHSVNHTAFYFFYFFKEDPNCSMSVNSLKQVTDSDSIQRKKKKVEKKEAFNFIKTRYLFRNDHKENGLRLTQLF